MKSDSDQSTKGARAEKAKWVGFRISELLGESGLSGAEIARRAKISDQQFSRFINGLRLPGAHILDRIAVALNTTTDDLLSQRSKLLERDRRSFIAMTRIQHIGDELASEDLEFLADIAATALDRRREERIRLIADSDPALEPLALCFEQLLPIIARKSRGGLDSIHFHDDGLMIIVTVAQGENSRVLANTLKKLACEKMRLSERKVSCGAHNDSVVMRIDIPARPTSGNQGN
jgi:transcriptional regulator with XRE-family HTH domain